MTRITIEIGEKEYYVKSTVETVGETFPEVLETFVQAALGAGFTESLIEESLNDDSTNILLDNKYFSDPDTTLDDKDFIN